MSVYEIYFISHGFTEMHIGMWSSGELGSAGWTR